MIKSMKVITFLLSLSFVFLSSKGMAKSDFSQINCRLFHESELHERRMSNATVQSLQARYADIGLKLLASDGLKSDPYQISFWQLCGRQFIFLLESKGKVSVVRDAEEIQNFDLENLLLPGVLCKKSDGTQSTNLVGFYVHPSKDKKKSIRQLWLIDLKKMKFIKQNNADYTCE